MESLSRDIQYTCNLFINCLLEAQIDKMHIKITRIKTSAEANGPRPLQNIGEVHLLSDRVPQHVFLLFFLSI